MVIYFAFFNGFGGRILLMELCGNTSFVLNQNYEKKNIINSKLYIVRIFVEVFSTYKKFSSNHCFNIFHKLTQVS